MGGSMHTESVRRFQYSIYYSTPVLVHSTEKKSQKIPTVLVNGEHMQEIISHILDVTTQEVGSYF